MVHSRYGAAGAARKAAAPLALLRQGFLRVCSERTMPTGLVLVVIRQNASGERNMQAYEVGWLS